MHRDVVGLRHQAATRRWSGRASAASLMFPFTPDLWPAVMPAIVRL